MRIPVEAVANVNGAAKQANLVVLWQLDVAERITAGGEDALRQLILTVPPVVEMEPVNGSFGCGYHHARVEPTADKQADPRRTRHCVPGRGGECGCQLLRPFMLRPALRAVLHSKPAVEGHPPRTCG